MSRLSEIPPTTRILLDCRWLGTGGPGRATEYLLRGLQELEPTGKWILWGPDDVREFAWQNAESVVTTLGPRWLPSQVAALTMPKHDVAVYMHQVRPLRPGKSVTVVHDSIALRHNGSWLRRQARRASHYAVARLTTSVITVSEYARETLLRDLPLGGRSIRVVRYPVDPVLVRRVSELRQTMEARPRALFVGRFAPHKNLSRLIQAFGQSDFAASGGELLLVGGDPRGSDELQEAASGVNVHFEGVVPQTRLEELYATSRLLVMPSLEEGFGLPAWEALTVGLPVCASDVGSLPEVTQGHAVLCDPTSVDAIASGIDEAARRPKGECVSGPTMSDFAQGYLDSILEVIGSRDHAFSR